MESLIIGNTIIINNTINSYENDRKQNWVVTLDKEYMKLKYYNKHFLCITINNEKIIDINKNVISSENILSSFVISINDTRRLEMIHKIKYRINFIESATFGSDVGGMEKSRILGLNHISCWKMAHKMNLNGAFFFGGEVNFLKDLGGVVN